MNQDGAPNPKTASDRSSGSPHEHTQHTLSDASKHISKRNTPDLLAKCAKSDRGGGVGLNHEIFAIYSTAALPPLWTDILHSLYAVGNVSSTIERLRVLADQISTSLPIYTCWNDISQSPSNHKTLEIHSLNPSPPTPTSTDLAHNLIHRKKPDFLLNASRYKKHCIIGQHSKTETLLAVLRRPWCVLEICVSNVHDVGVLEAIRAFARVAQEVDARGYGTAEFLLGVEIEARRHHARRRQTVNMDHRWNDSHLHERKLPSKRVYELCNTTVFLPSLKSFNSFWIRLICVCAVELGISFSYIIHMLCNQQQVSDHVNQDVEYCKSEMVFAGIDIVHCGGRRHSTTDLSSSRPGVEEEGDIVQKMLDLYKQVMRRTEDYI